MNSNIKSSITGFTLVIGVLLSLGAGCTKNSTGTNQDISARNNKETPIENTNKPNAVSMAPVLDYGKIEATVIEILHPDNPQIDYGKIRVDKIIEYTHHPKANYTALAKDDELKVYFQWGAKATIVDESPIGSSANDINLPGVAVGDKIRVNIQGCPEEFGCGNGWTLYEYSLIN